jgi:hypothetical protein
MLAEVLRMNRAILFLVTTAILIGFSACTEPEKANDSEYTPKVYKSEDDEHHIEYMKNMVFSVIAQDFEDTGESNISLLQIMHDEAQNRYWVEFYDIESFLSCLWLGFVVIDATNKDIIHIDTQITLYSGVTPEMAMLNRKSSITELQNEYGNFHRVT